MVEDNDIINMVDEDDLLEAVRQRLNPLRLEVWITCQKGDTQSNNAIPNGGTQSNNGTTATLKEQEQENGNDCKFHNHFCPSTPSLSIESSIAIMVLRILRIFLSGPSPSPISRDVSGPSKMTFGIFQGVQCDGCGMCPIEGPSKM